MAISSARRRVGVLSRSRRAGEGAVLLRDGDGSRARVAREPLATALAVGGRHRFQRALQRKPLGVAREPSQCGAAEVVTAGTRLGHGCRQLFCGCVASYEAVLALLDEFRRCCGT